MSENPTDDGAGDALGQRRFLSNTLNMATGTMVSRVLGLVRSVLVIYLLGASTRQADLFSLSGSVPTQVYMLLVGGVLDAILVPQLVKAARHDEDGGQAFTDRIVTLFLLLVGGVTLILVIATPVVLQVMVSSEWRAPGLEGQYSNLLLLAALAMPQLLFYGLFYLGGQILNSRGTFAPMMWAPVVNNIVQIAILSIYAWLWGFNGSTDTSKPFTMAQVLVLALGSLAAIACQAGVLIPFLKKVGFRYRPRFDFLHTGLGATAHLAKWTIAMTIVDQFYLIINTRLGSRATVGGEGAGNTVVTSAGLIWLLPHALLTVSFATALLPSLSRLAAALDWKAYATTFVTSLRTVMVGIVPLSLLLVALGEPMATMIFRRSVDGQYIGWTIAAFGLGVIPHALWYLSFRGFYAQGNTRSPFFLECMYAVVTVCVGATLIMVVQVRPAWIAPSIGIATTCASLVAGSCAWLALKRSVAPMRGQRIVAHIARLVVLAVPGTAIAWLICWYQRAHLTGFVFDVLSVAIAGTLAVVVFFLLARLAKVGEASAVLRLFRDRLLPRRRSA